MARGGAVQHRTGEVGIEIGKSLHVFDRELAQPGQALARRVGLVQRLIAAQRLFDFLVVGQAAAAGSAELACRLALGAAVVEAAVLGQNARRRVGDAAAHVLVFHCD